MYNLLRTLTVSKYIIKSTYKLSNEGKYVNAGTSVSQFLDNNL